MTSPGNCAPAKKWPLISMRGLSKHPTMLPASRVRLHAEAV
jgi:hypothetical protein